MQVFLNGAYLPREEARVSVLDRGFLFGDGVYEVIPVYSNRLFRISEHLLRLGNSLGAVDIPNPYTEVEWQNIARELLENNPSSGDRSLYIEVTRGVGEREHMYPDNMVPTVFMMCYPLVMKNYIEGISAITHMDIRWHRCSIKAITLLPNILLRQLARETDGSYEAILLRDGLVTEGAASNVFIVKNDIISTPPKDESILPGVTRDLLVELMLDAGMPCQESDISASQLREADEIWLTGSTTGVAPVVRLDGKAVLDGIPGKWWQQANDLFCNYLDRYRAGLDGTDIK